MSVKNKVIAITKQSCLINLISQNKQICSWHYYLVYISNIFVVKALKLVNNLSLGIINKKYNLTKIFINFDNFNNFKTSNNKEVDFSSSDLDIILSFIAQTNNLDKLYKLFVRRKSI